MDLDFEIFKGKKFTDLCKDIYVNQLSRKEQIDVMINDLRPMIKTVNDAMVVVPLIKGYMDTGNTNDDHLIKLASIAQKLMTAQTTDTGGAGGLGLTEEEKKALWKDIEQMQEAANTVQPEIDTLKKETESVVKKK